MAENPDELLRRAAARPHGGPDLDRLRARAARRRKLRRTGAALSAVAVLGVGSAAAVTLSAPGDDEISLQEPATPAASPTPEATPSPLDHPDDDLVPETDAVPGEGSEPDADAEADSDTEDDEPPFYANTEPDERPGATDQEMAVLSRVRVGAHDGYDRVVWEFSEGDRPRVRVEYVDEPRQPGSGDPVDVAGSAYLRLIAEFATDRGAELYAPGAEPYEGPSRLDGGNAQVVREVVSLGDFEANMQWAIGVDQERPFRIRVLEDPLRIAVDVRHR